MIVYHGLTANLRVEWNESATYNVFYGRKNVACFTNDTAHNHIQAGRVARQWIIDNVWGA